MIVSADDVELPIVLQRAVQTDFERHVGLMDFGGDAVVESTMIGGDIKVIDVLSAVGGVFAVV